HKIHVYSKGSYFGFLSLLLITAQAIQGGEPQSVGAPEIVFVSPSDEPVNVSVPAIEIDFRVRSNRPLIRVEVIHDKRVLFRQESPEKLVEIMSGIYQVPTIKLKLQLGLNRLQIVAANGKNATKKEILVTVVSPVAKLSVERFRDIGGEKKV